MKKIILLFLVLFLLISIVDTSKVEVNVPEVLKGKISSVFFGRISDSGVVKVKLEFNNIGSIPFNSRVRMEIFDQGDMIYTLWSDEVTINPSERKVFDFSSYINKVGSFKTKIRIYYGGEVLDYDNVTFEVDDVKPHEDNFEINRLRVSGDYIKFDVECKEDTDNVVIIFSDYPKSWIIEQKNIERLEKNNKSPIKIKYIPISPLDKEISIHVFTDDGNFYKTEKITLKKEAMLNGIINNILDFFIGIF